jgi:hypothetical protein
VLQPATLPHTCPPQEALSAHVVSSQWQHIHHYWGPGCDIT